MTGRRDSHHANVFAGALLLLLAIAVFNGNTADAASIPQRERHASHLVVPPPRLPHPLYGVTVDSIQHLGQTVDALQSLARRPTVRVVFDEGMPASYYAAALQRLHAVSYVMGELVDSSAMARYNVEQYTARTQEYLDTVASFVDIWEIGNEVNGEWLGDPADVAAKLTRAFELARQRGARTAVTLYYNEDCWRYPWEEMFTWAEQRLSAAMKRSLDYVLISYYEDDCNGLRPDWVTVFQRLGRIFPNSYLGFGEVGTLVDRRKRAYLQRYYMLRLDHPAYVGGYFWWHFVQDMVPRTKPLWRVLDSAISQDLAPPFESGRSP